MAGVSSFGEPAGDPAAAGGGASAPEGAGPSRSSGQLLRSILSTAAIAALIYVLVTFLVQTVRVEGASMEGTLETGNLLIASKISLRLGSPSRGDIVVFHPPDAPSRDLIKRVIGVPGDVFEVDGHWVDPAKPGSTPQTVILVKPDGHGAWQRLDEPYLPEPWVVSTNCCTSNGLAVPSPPTPMTIPSGMYELLGDNRNVSRDSRAFGLVPRGDIFAMAWLRIWPLGHFGFTGPGPSLVSGAALVPAMFLPGVARARRRRRTYARIGAPSPAAPQRAQ